MRRIELGTIEELIGLGINPYSVLYIAQRFAVTYWETVTYRPDEKTWLLFGPHTWYEDKDGAMMRLVNEFMRNELFRAANLENIGMRIKALQWANVAASYSRIKAIIKAARNYMIDANLILEENINKIYM